jgi:hypothetical protein
MKKPWDKSMAFKGDFGYLWNFKRSEGLGLSREQLVEGC